MSRRLVDRLLADLPTQDSYFVQKFDAARRRGLSPLQKITAALRQLALGYGADATDEYCRLGGSTARESLYRFCTAVRGLYEDKYLRQPTQDDFNRILAINANRGFPGMLGSLDCMHYAWKNCPVAWQGDFRGKEKVSSIILEAIANHELWIWHAFFGLSGSQNDLNVLYRSPLLNNLVQGNYSHNRFVLAGSEFCGAYLLVDGIYPKWSCFVPTIAEPSNEKTKLFAKMQEAMRKDVERAFGVLQSRFHIIPHAARSWHLDRVVDIMICYIILHNMIIEDQRGEPPNEFHNCEPAQTASSSNLPWRSYLQAVGRIEDKDLHFTLQNALIDHVWEEHGRRRSNRAFNV